jgi:hypothetical protein
MGLLAEITEPFYDVEDSRRALTQPDVFRALGTGSFACLLDGEVGYRVSHANRLIVVVKRAPHRARQYSQRQSPTSVWRMVDRRHHVSGSCWKGGVPLKATSMNCG